MAYSFAEIRTFQGLFLQQNSFQVPDGAMEEAKNIVIRSDDVITKTNGFYMYWEASPLHIIDYGVPRATVSFNGVTVMFSANDTGRFSSENPDSGPVNAVGNYLSNGFIKTKPTYSKIVTTFEQNNNLYVTANESIRKLETPDGVPSRAGVPPSLTLRLESLIYANNGYLTALDAGSQTAYRFVIGRRDTHGNLLLGAPSDILVVGIPKKQLLVAYEIVDFLGQNYVQFTYPLDPYTSPAIDSFVISDATNTALNGPQQFSPSGDPDKISFETTEPVGTGTFSVAITGGVAALRFEVPSELEGPSYEYFYQLYRTSPSLSETSSPVADFKLVVEKTLTENEYESRSIYVEDNVDERLKGAELYTNPNTREGEQEQNSRPPLAKYAGLYKQYAMYANIQTVQRMVLNMANPEELIGVDLIFSSGVDQEVYRAVNPDVYLPGTVKVGTVTVLGTDFLVVPLPSGMTFPVGSTVLVNNIQNGTMIAGEYELLAWDGTQATIGVNGTADFVDIEFVSDGTARLYDGFGAAYNTSGDTGFKTVAQWTAYVAQNLCRAINLNYNSFMYANYNSGFEQFPGEILIQSKEFIDPIYVRYSVLPDSQPFLQNIPDSFGSGIQYYSDNDIKPHYVCPAKLGEPEAVPILHFIPVGSSSAEIVGQAGTRDSWIVLKEDGVFRIRGDSYETMIVEPIDLTVKFQKGINSVLGTINNTIIAFCDQGVVQITDTSMQLISRRIEDVIQPLIGKDISRTFMYGHEVDRLFYVCTENINAGQTRKTWVYNVLNKTWTELERDFDHISIDATKSLMGLTIDVGNAKYRIWRQRRTNSRIDYCGEWLQGIIETDSVLYPDKMKGDFQITLGNDVIPGEGDVILSGNVFNRIIEVSEDGGVYTLTFAQPVSWAVDVEHEVVLYKAYESLMKFAPFHAGMVGRMKHFAQLQIHLRQQVITDLIIDFAGAYYNGSDSVDWQALNLSTQGAQGWGFSPWGQFPWGLSVTANLLAGTEAAAIIRTYVPRLAARNTWIAPRLKHACAGQPMFIQALNYSIHSQRERVSK